MNFTLITSAIAAMAGFALAWQLQAHDILKLKLEQSDERISVARANRAIVERQSNAVITAQNSATGRAVVLRRDAAAAQSSADGLRSDLDATQRAASATIDACNYHSSTISQLLIESAAVNRELAQACDGHASDVRTLSDGWPKSLVSKEGGFTSKAM